MAQSRKIVVETPIECPQDDFYKLFKEQACHLPEICGSVVKKIELVPPTSSWVSAPGSRKKIHYEVSPGNSTATITDEVVGVDVDSSKKIIFKVSEGPMLDLYSSFKVTLEVTAGSTAKWTIEYVKKDAANDDAGVYAGLLANLNYKVSDYIPGKIIPPCIPPYLAS